jgi:hypothetical protein
MRRTIALLLLVGLMSCEQATPRPSASPSQAPCAPAIAPGPPLNPRLTTTDVPIGFHVVFGLDGAFVGSAFGYPLGASRQWTLRDESGRTTGAIDWYRGSHPLASPDGSRVAYVAAPPDVPGLTVRDVAGGPPRLVAAGDLPPYGWLDDQHVLLDPYEEHGVIHSIDVTDGTDTVVFRPPLPSFPNPAGSEWDYWAVSGDLRWTILQRADGQGKVTDQWLYDARDGRQVASFGLTGWILSPHGDIAVAFEGDSIKAMHLCDQRIVELASRAGSAVPWGAHWSPDGRYVSVTYGSTDETTGPENVVIVEPQAGRVGIANGPWGYIHTWSPDLRYVVLGRRGYHDVESRIARLDLDGR